MRRSGSFSSNRARRVSRRASFLLAGLRAESDHEPTRFVDGARARPATLLPCLGSSIVPSPRGLPARGSPPGTPAISSASSRATPTTSRCGPESSAERTRFVPTGARESPTPTRHSPFELVDVYVGVDRRSLRPPWGRLCKPSAWACTPSEELVGVSDAATGQKSRQSFDLTMDRGLQ